MEGQMSKNELKYNIKYLNDSKCLVTAHSLLQLLKFICYGQQ